MSAATQPALEQVIQDAIAGGITDLKKDLEGKSAEQQTAMVKLFTESTIPDLIGKALPGAIAAQITELKASNERLIKERTARPPSAFGSGDGGEFRSLGERFADIEQFKSWVKNDRSRDRLSLVLEARILSPNQQKAVTIAGSGVTIPKYQAGLIAPVPQALVMRDLLPVTPITSNGIEYQQVAISGEADYQVAEGDKKAEAGVSYTPKTASVRTIAVFLKASRQMVADVPLFASTVDNQLLYMIALKEDREILFGDNAAGHLHGIMPQAPALGAAVIADQTTPADQLLAGIAYLASLGYPATGIVMNPLDWASLQSQKLATGAYLLGGPPASFPPNSLWGIPIVMTSAMTAGNFLIGNFNLGATLFDRESANVDIAFENEDDFVRNMVTIRAEERLALAVWRPTAFVKSTITFPTPTP